MGITRSTLPQKKGKGNLPLFRGNVERVIPFYAFKLYLGLLIYYLVGVIFHVPLYHLGPGGGKRRQIFNFIPHPHIPLVITIEASYPPMNYKIDRVIDIG